MTDIVDPATRSRMMANIKSANTKPELKVRKALHAMGYRYRLGTKIGKIKPDIVLPKYKVAIFVHGCYWHQHEGCKLAYSDRSYSEKWLAKFKANKERDERTLKTLMQCGWRVATIWECVTRETRKFPIEISHLDRFIRGRANKYETGLIRIKGSEPF